uniref:hypothetical protein n=1 Tax=Sciscionella sediminilitoris TaxID=1445613 RepID=UPI001E44C44A
MHYRSKRALKVLDDSEFTVDQERGASLGKWFAGSLRTTIRIQKPSTKMVVNRALKTVKRDRPVHRKLNPRLGTDSIFDIRIEALELGIMPFLSVGGCEVQTFWGNTFVEANSRRVDEDPWELILLGSLDGVIGEAWIEDDKKLMIGHQYPSDPSVLCRLVCEELELSGRAVSRQIESIDRWDWFGPGCYARFASRQTKRWFQ